MLALVCLGLFVLFLFCIFVPHLALRFIVPITGVLILSGCTQLGISQSENESLYTTGATAARIAMDLGKGSPDQYCRGDTVAYSILITSRNPADGVKSYAPADNAHKGLQNDGVKLSGDCTAIP